MKKQTKRNEESKSLLDEKKVLRNNIGSLKSDYERIAEEYYRVLYKLRDLKTKHEQLENKQPLKYIIYIKRLYFGINNNKKAIKHCSTLAYHTKPKSKQYSKAKIKTLPILKLFLYSLYITCKGVCVLNSYLHGVTFND